MTTLVLGGNGSGKSSYAEKLVQSYKAAPLYYIATMVPFGEEGRARVEKHRAQRKDIGFITIEQPFEVSAIDLPHDAVVLLEDVSNLLSNALFGGERNGGADSVYEDIVKLCSKCRHAVLVSIDGLSASGEFNEETNAYIVAFNGLNERLFNFADDVISMQNYKPVVLKHSGCEARPPQQSL